MLAVVGSRDFDDYKLLIRSLDNAGSFTTIISGGARGADTLAEQYGREHKKNLAIFHAEWNLYGKKAGPIRNTRIAEKCDRMIAFWDLTSRGTRDVINKALQLGKPVTIVPFRPKPKPRKGL